MQCAGGGMCGQFQLLSCELHTGANPGLREVRHCLAQELLFISINTAREGFYCHCYLLLYLFDISIMKIIEV